MPVPGEAIVKIEMNKEEVKVAVAQYLKGFLGVEAAPEEITLKDEYGRLDVAVWEKNIITGPLEE